MKEKDEEKIQENELRRKKPVFKPKNKNNLNNLLFIK